MHRCVQDLRHSFRRDEVVVPLTRHVGDEFNRQLLRLALKGAVRLVHEHGQPSVASYREDLAIGACHRIAEGCRS